MHTEDSVLVRSIKKLNSFMNKIVSAIHDVAGVAMMLLILLVAFQVMMRYVFNSPVYGVDEFVVFLLIWYASLGFIVVTWNNEHAKIEFFLKKCPHFVKVIEYITIYVVAFCFGCVLIDGGITLWGIQHKSATVGGLPFPRSYYYALPMIVCGILLCITTAFRVFSYLVLKDDALMTGSPDLLTGEGKINVD